MTQRPTVAAENGNLTRPIQPIPEFVEESLKHHGLAEAYRARPAYQKNDYIGWINRAKRSETKLKRLNQMLDELRAGGIYMRMEHPSSRRE